MHGPPQDSPVMSPPGIRFLCRIQSHPCHTECPCLEQLEECHPRGRPYLTSDRIPSQPVQFKWASTSSSAYKNMDNSLPPHSATILLLRGAAQSASQTSSLSSGLRPVKWAWLDLDSPQKTLGRTVSALSEPWPCTSWGSQIRPSWP